MKQYSPKPPVTQKQIADELGVSRQLVSLVLNGTGRISEENRRRVREAAERLGYDINTNHEARAMIARRYSKRARTGLLGCLYVSSVSPLQFPEGGHLPYETHLLHGIRQAAHEHGRDVLLLPPTPSSGWDRVDGLLVHGGAGADFRERIGTDLPAVGMMTSIPNTSCVGVRDKNGARQATEYLIQLGHRRIAYMALTEGTPAVQERIEGYQEVLREHGITPRKSWIGELMNLGPMLDRGYASMRHWLQSGWGKLGCTALMVQNDRAAVGVMTALRQAGISVPHDLSIIGYDSTDECELTVPRLTSVQVPLEEVGARAARLLIDEIESEGGEEAPRPEPQIVEMDTQLQIRDSTAPPPKS